MQDSIQSPAVKPIPSSDAGFTLDAETLWYLNRPHWIVNFHGETRLTYDWWNPPDDDPVIGYNAPLARDAWGDELCRASAWQMIHISGATTFSLPGLGIAPYTLGLSGASKLPKTAEIYGLPVDVMARWYGELLRAHLITEELSIALLDALPIPDKRPRRPIPWPVKMEIFSKSKGICTYCMVVLTMESGRPNSFECDHVLPVSRGGSDDIANLAPVCFSCNRKKKNKSLLQFWEENHG